VRAAHRNLRKAWANAEPCAPHDGAARRPQAPWTYRDAILTHPTITEGLGALFANVPPRATQSGAPQDGVMSTVDDWDAML
jgi:hypothetical protein